MKQFNVREGIVYNENYIEVPNNKTLQEQISKIINNTKLAGYPGHARALVLFSHSFTWKSIRAYTNRYVDRFNLYQRIKAIIHKPFCTLEPIPIPAGPWTEIS